MRCNAAGAGSSSISIAGQTIVIVAHQRIDVRVGEEIPFDVAGTDLHLFAPDTGSIIAHGGVPI